MRIEESLTITNFYYIAEEYEVCSGWVMLFLVQLAKRNLAWLHHRMLTLHNFWLFLQRFQHARPGKYVLFDIYTWK